MSKNTPVLVLALGNDILTDDAAALITIRHLQYRFHPQIHYYESAETGLALLEKLEGYDKVLILDTIASTEYAQGSIIELIPQSFSSLDHPSPHYAGLPDIFRFAKWYGIKIPDEIQILAMVIPDRYEFGEKLSDTIKSAIPDYIHKAENIIHTWISN